MLYLLSVVQTNYYGLHQLSVWLFDFLQVHYAIAWANINLFDFTNRFLSDKMSVKLWPMPPGLDDMLNPIGVPGNVY